MKKIEKGIVLIGIYIDDLIIIGDNDAYVCDVKLHLKEKFEIKDLGEMQYLLHNEVIRSPSGPYSHCRDNMDWIC